MPNKNKNKSNFLPFKFKVAKAENGDMSFTAYANVKNVKDHAWDIAVDGCYQASIDTHKANGTAPRLLWTHDTWNLPVGTITSMEEDDHGLKIEGAISNTTQGRDIYVLCKDGALDSFSIGYRVIKEEWNQDAKANLLQEIEIREVSFVNFACCEPSLLTDIKTHLEDGELPSKRELQNFLRNNGFSKSQATAITNNYNDKEPKKVESAFNLAKSLSESSLFK